jgi:hypothetical protein
MQMLMILILQTKSLEEVSRKIFSAHFGQLSNYFLMVKWNAFPWCLFLKLYMLG